MAFVLLSPPNPTVALPLKSQKPASPLLKFPITLLSLAGAPTTGRGPRPLFLTAVSPASEVADVEEKPETSLPSPSYKDPEGISDQGLEKSVLLLKQAAKTRMVPAVDVLSAISAIKKAKVDSSSFLETLGGSESPGRTWMLIFSAQSRLDKGSYFPVTAVQRFDATDLCVNHCQTVSPDLLNLNPGFSKSSGYDGNQEFTLIKHCYDNHY